MKIKLSKLSKEYTFPKKIICLKMYGRKGWYCHTKNKFLSLQDTR